MGQPDGVMGHSEKRCANGAGRGCRLNPGPDMELAACCREVRVVVGVVVGVVAGTRRGAEDTVD